MVTSGSGSVTSTKVGNWYFQYFHVQHVDLAESYRLRVLAGARVRQALLNCKAPTILRNDLALLSAIPSAVVISRRVGVVVVSRRVGVVVISRRVVVASHKAGSIGGVVLFPAWG